MVLKCCIPLCKGNYDSSSERVPVYKLPKDEKEKRKWILVIPRANLVVSKYTAVCGNHWPNDAEMIKVHGKLRPKNPPSVFPGISSGCLSSQPSTSRKTNRTLSEIRNQHPDEMEGFIKTDTLVYDEIADKIKANFPTLAAYTDSSGCLVIQSQTLNFGIPQLVIKMKKDFTFECYFVGSPCRVPSVTTTCRTWSALNEIIRFLSSKEVTHKSKILLQQVSVTDRNSGQEKLYSTEMIMRAFEYFSTSRALYSRIAQDYQLPSIRTLTRITSKVSKVDETKFLLDIFRKLPRSRRKCVILWDEIYIKSALTYHGGTVFGKAIDSPDKLAKTVLAIMVKCLFGGPEFIYKIYLIKNLTAKFLSDEGSQVMEAIESESTNKVIAIIADGHRTNQKCFASLSASSGNGHGVPWLNTQSNIYLLFDYVHVVKCIRNKWLTEKTQQLEYAFNGNTQIAKWSDLKNLQQAESDSLVKLSKLTEVAISPKPIERQSVQTCLRVFCDDTIAALETHPVINNANGLGTTNFIKIVVKLWKIFNVRSPREDQAHNDPLRAVIRMHNDPRLQFLLDVAAMADRMKPKESPRVCSLTQDTSKFLSHICRGAVDLVRHLLSRGNEYEMLGWFSTDPLEKAFGKLRQGSGGTYFITALTVVEKVNIQHAKLFLQLGIDLPQDGNAQDDGHQCAMCSRLLNEKECEVFDNMHA